MIKKAINWIHFLLEINVKSFIYLNWFCESVIRTDKGKIIPYKNTVIEIEASSKIYIAEADLELGCNKVKKSKAETRVRLRKNSIWSAQGGCKISYGSTLELLEGALFEHGYFTMNSNSVLISHKHIAFGEDVMISRNVLIYDSDFHPLFYNNRTFPMSKEINVGNHVWLGANAMILKGVSIGDDAVIAANALVTENVSEQTLVGSENQQRIIMKNVHWER